VRAASGAESINAVEATGRGFNMDAEK